MQVPVVQQQFWILSDLLAEREMQIYLDCPWSSIPRNLLDKKKNKLSATEGYSSKPTAVPVRLVP